MLYVADGNVYMSDEQGKVHPVDVLAKDKVVEVHEVDSVEFKVHEETCELPQTAFAATANEIVAKFNISETNPCKFDKKAASGKSKKKVEE